MHACMCNVFMVRTYVLKYNFIIENQLRLSDLGVVEMDGQPTSVSLIVYFVMYYSG